MIKHWNAKSRYWQNHVDYILAINASLILCEEPSTATIVSHVKFSRPPLKSRNVLPIFYVDFTYCAHFEMWNIYCRKINADDISVTKVIYKFNYEIKMFYMCVRRYYNIFFCIAEICRLIYLCSVLLTHTDFNKSQPALQAVWGKAVLRLL